MKNFMIWLLTGALGASLTLHLRDTAAAPTCGDESPQACDEFASDCGSSCAMANDLERQSRELAAELWDTLGSETVDHEAARELARRIGELRGKALEACVDAVLRARESMTTEEMRALLENCRDGACLPTDASR